MQVIRVVRNRLELTSIPMDQPLITVGRSTSCDVVLKAPGVTMTNFLIKWKGEGEFNPQKGEWHLIDLSSLGSQEFIPNQHLEAPGVQLGGQSISFNGLNFSIVEDRLATPDFDGPLRMNLAKTLKNPRDGNLSLLKDGCSLEVVEFNTQLSSVLSVQHLYRKPTPARLRCLPKVKILWENTNLVSVFISSRHPHQAFLDGQAIPNGPKTIVNLEAGRLLQIDSASTKAILRLVPVLEGIPTEIQPLHKSPWAWCLLGFSATIVFLGFWRMMAEFKTPPPPPPKLTAQIEIKVKNQEPPAPAPPSPQPREILPEPPPQPVAVKPPPVEVAQPPIEKPEPPAPPTPAPIAKPAKTNPPIAEKPKVKNKTKAPASNADQMWLLSTLSKGSSHSRIKADVLTTQGLKNQRQAQEDTISLQKPQLETGFLNDRSPHKQLRDIAEQNTTADAAQLFKGSKLGRASKGNTKALMAGDFSDSMTKGGGQVDFQQARMSGGGLSRQEVLGAIEKKRGFIKECYDNALIQNPKINGRVLFQWIISPSGAVKSLKMVETQVKFPALEECVKGVLESLNFPSAKNGKSTLVDYPFIFTKSK